MENRGWDQPDSADILISDDGAAMPQHVFDQLKEYSSSFPSGVYPGKMWRAHIGDRHYLRWYGVVPGDDSVCSNNQREISILDWMELTGAK